MRAAAIRLLVCGDPTASSGAGPGPAAACSVYSGMASGGDRQRGEGQAGRPTGRPGRGAPPRPGAGPPEPDAVQQQLAELYKGMPLDELTRQGKEHLAGDTRQRAKRAVHLGWVVCWSLVAGGLLLIGIFSLWLLFMAKKSGTSFAHMREQAMSAYSGDE